MNSFECSEECDELWRETPKRCDLRCEEGITPGIGRGEEEERGQTGGLEFVGYIRVPACCGNTFLNFKIEGGVSISIYIYVLGVRALRRMDQERRTDRPDESLGILQGGLKLGECASFQGTQRGQTVRYPDPRRSKQDLPAKVPSPFTVKIRATINKVLLVPEYQ